jgi:hypothetical protein
MTQSTALAAAPRRPWAGRVFRVAGAWLALEAVLVALAIAWVAFYSYAIDPGHEPGFYQDYASRVSPIVAIIISAPVFGAFGILAARRGGRPGARFALTTTVVFLVLDFALIALVPERPQGIWTIWLTAAALKLSAVVLGGRYGARAAGARA